MGYLLLCFEEVSIDFVVCPLFLSFFRPNPVQDMLLRICCAMIMTVRDRLLAGDFTQNLKLLQNYPPIDVNFILRTAHRLKIS